MTGAESDMGMTQRADAPGDSAPIVDPAVIDGLRAALGPATDTLIAKASEMVRDRVARLRDRIAAGDGEAARTAHEIGGVAGQIGLARLATVALGVEQDLRSGAPDRVAAARAEAADLAALTETSLAALRDR
jgi:HPt (histidine-containing phosphotransfer) domain-containing protein